jgi:protein transport protein SEC61 subunit gamma-like protein
MEAVELLYGPAKKFADDCRRVLKRCSLPSMKVIKKTALSTAAGFAILGTIGFVFKLVSIPINNVIIGSMINK